MPTTKTTVTKTTAILFFIFAFSSFASAEVAVSQLGYHPSSAKQVVWYTAIPAGEFSVNDAGSNAIVFGPFAFSAAATCQGGRPCLVGDFSSFSQSGNFYISTPEGNSANFNINSNIYGNTAPKFLEFFNAHLQQNSAYHGDFHKFNNPKFLSMADGSFIMMADQAALPLIRLGSAYRRNPSLFDINNHQISAGGKDDLVEYVHNYVEYLKGLQQNTGSGNYAVAEGWDFDFNCWPDVDLNGMWNTEQDSCQSFSGATNQHITIITLLAYLESLPALNEYSPSYAESMFAHSKNMYNFIISNYGSVSGDDAAFLGAAEFLLYDYTNNIAYLQSAHGRKGSVSWDLVSDTVRGNEFYWEEYVRHKAQLSSASLVYPLSDGRDPEALFLGKMIGDYNAISQTGDKVYQFANDVQFQNSRFILVEGSMAAKNVNLNGVRPEHPGIDRIADYQLAWLTGMNSVQMGESSTSPTSSISFIFGIGNDPVAFHSLMVPRETYGNVNFNNGLNYIPGWINGAFDKDGDGVFNYVDSTGAWEFTETTNEMVATALELYAYLDGQYNNKARASQILFENNPPTCTPTTEVCDSADNDCDGQIDEGGVCTPACTPSTEVCNSVDDNCNGQIDENSVCSPPPPTTNCSNSVSTLPVNCSAAITSDTYDGCRHISCSNSDVFMNVKACNKDSGFEIYKQQNNGTLAICIGNTCMSGQGYLVGENFPICYQTQTQNNPPSNPPPSNNPPPSSNSGGSSSGGSGGRSGGGGGGGGGSFKVCQFNWQCGNWSSCQSGFETRDCSFVKVKQYTQKTECPSEAKEPETSRECEMPNAPIEEAFDLPEEDSDTSDLMEMESEESEDIGTGSSSVDVSSTNSEKNNTMAAATGAFSFMSSGNGSKESLFRPRDLIIAGFIVAFVVLVLVKVLFKGPKTDSVSEKIQKH